MMFIRKKIFSLGVFLIAITLVLTACGNSGSQTSGTATTDSKGSSEEAKTFKLAHITPTDHLWHRAAEKFGEELKTRSDGKMSLEIYPSSQLGTEADMVQQIESGSIDFGFITAAYLSSRAPDFAAWFMPYGFASLEDAYAAGASDVGKKILASAEGTGLKGLGYLLGGQRVMIFKDKEAMSPEDMKGLKLRVTPSPPMQDFYKSAGVSPEGLPLPDVYAALQTGVIDGMDMDLDATITNKFYEVTKYAAVTNHMVWPSVILTNDKKFNSLSTEEQTIVNDSLQAAIDWAKTTRTAEEDQFRAELEKNAMKVYEIPADKFEKQITDFDNKYKEQSPLIKEFIETFRK